MYTSRLRELIISCNVDHRLPINFDMLTRKDFGEHSTKFTTLWPYLVEVRLVFLFMIGTMF